MDLTTFMHTDLFNWVIMPLLIFIARIIDISLGTIRVIMITKGLKNYAPLIGFFEVLIWLVVVRQIMTSMNNFVWVIAYAAGFAAGTYVGMFISERIKMGHVLFRIITRKDASKLLEGLKEKKYRYTLSHGTDEDEEANIVFTIVPNKQIPEVAEIIKEHYPLAFYTIEDVRKVKHGVQEKHHPAFNWYFPFKRNSK